MVDEVRVARLLRSITDDLAVLQRARGDYVDVDDRVVLDRLDDPSDLAAFVAAIAGRLS